MKSLRILATIVATNFLLMPMSAVADDITISFEGVVEWENTVPWVVDCFGLDPNVDTITGLFIYSTSDVIDTHSDPDKFHAQFYVPPNSVVVEVGGLLVETDSDDIETYLRLYDGVFPLGSDKYGFGSENNSSNMNNTECGEVGPVDFDTYDNDGDAIDLEWPVTIPTDAPDLDQWVGSRNFRILFEFGELHGTLTSMQRLYLVDDIVAALETLRINNPLDPEQETGLYQKVASAMDKFARDKVDQGCQQLSAFICQLEALLPMFEQTEDADLANAILDTAYEIFGDQCSVTDPVVMECAKWETD